MRAGIHSATSLTSDHELQADVCVVGSGAGGAVLAAGLTEAGLNVVMLEAGSHRTQQDFKALDEAKNFPMLYQERGTRASDDLSLTIMQGRTVGGSTTVNWTTCFRTPEHILAHWREHHGTTLSAPELAPHFEAVEARLHIQRWHEPLVNPNNGALLRGCRALGLEASIIKRNVKGCANSGYCGFGCPVDGKQAMHLTYLKDATEAGLELWSDARVDRLEVQGGRVVAAHATAMDPARDRPASPGRQLIVRAKVFVSAGGAINAPALLIRSGIQQGPVGHRTFVHPVVAVAAEYPNRVDPWFGAPQSVTSHEYVHRGEDRMGFFLEAAPLHPMIAATAFPLFGEAQAQVMSRMSHTSALIALHIDGLLPGDNGGLVTITASGQPKLHYPTSAALIEAMRASHQVLAKIHLAAGAVRCITTHNPTVELRGEADLPHLSAAPYGAHEHTIFTAHLMGGCAMGPDPSTSVVGLDLRHHHLPNLFCVDGSVLPTSLGVNPSQTIYGLAHWARAAVGSAV